MNPVIIYFIDLGLGLLVALAALRVYKRVNPDFRPLFVFIWFLVASQFLLSFLDDGPVYDGLEKVSYLIEAILVAWIARRWNAFGNNRTVFPVLVGFFLACWLVETFVTGNIHFGSWCKVLFYFVIATLGVVMLTRAFLTVPAQASRRTVNYFGVALIFYYVLSALAEMYVFIFIEQPAQSTLLIYFYFGAALSIITFILYLRSILCIPTKQTYPTS